MAFKMKGFPLRSGFAHADTKHDAGDHQHMEQQTQEEDTSNFFTHAHEATKEGMTPEGIICKKN